MKNLFFVLFLFPVLAFSQKTYTVGPKETLFSIGRALNIHPRELAEYNNIPFETGVKVGQVLKIPAVKKMPPLTDVPAAPTAATTNGVNTTAQPAEKPVTPVASTTATTTAKPVSAPAPKPSATNTVTSATVPVAKAAPTTPATQTTKPSVSSDMVPVYHKVEKKETLFQISQNAKVSIDDIKKWNKLTVDGVNEGTNLIVGYTKRNTGTTAKPAVSPAPAQVPAPSKPVVAENPIVPAPVATAVAVKNEPATSGGIVRNFNGGAFGIAYGSQHNGEAPSSNESGVAAIFKSTSGWNDGKYYCLHNAAPAGTIIKITSRSTGKFVYAKVLDVIPDLKQNEGLLIRLSNAAADELGVTAETFNVTLNY